MNEQITKIIEQYLSNELSAEDKKAFESRLKTNPKLQTELALQKKVHAGAKRASQRVKVQKLKKGYHTKKFLKKGAIVTLIAAAIALTVYLIASGITPITTELKERMDQEAQVENLDIQYFQIAKEGGVVLSAEGVLISIPKNAFLKDGKPFTGKTILQFQEAMDASDILKSGLNTMSGDRLLETQGMFGVTGFTEEGEALELNPKIGVYVQVPVDDYKEGMQLFDGVKDANGTIDWQTPVPLAKIPVTTDMSELNFYPSEYEPYLDRKKWKKDKPSRDSLYLSFEDWGRSEVASESEYIDGEGLFWSKCATCHNIDRNGTGPKLRHVRSKWEEYSTVEGSIYQWVRNWITAVKNDPYAEEIARLKPTASDNFPELSNAQIDAIFNYIDDSPDASEALTSLGGSELDSTSYYDETYYEIGPNANSAGAGEAAYNDFVSPSKVLGFWKDKFNETNLSTRAFENRMRAIHETCSDAVLEKYTGQLTKSLSAIDKQVVAMGHPQFQRFADENLAAVNPNNPHLKNLQTFYEKSISQLKDKGRRTQRKEQNKEEKWDKSVAKSRDLETKRSDYRETQALKEEYEFNMASVEKQIGPSVGFTLSHGGGTVVNIDAYVMEATIARKSATITDPFTGKTAEIVYNDFNFEVPNADKYIKLFAYVFPHELNSYQRIEGDQGKFDYPLNNEIIYDIAVVGITEDGYEYYQKQSFKSGELGAITMRRVSEEKLEASIEQLNGKRISKPVRIKEEVKWLMQERKDYQEQKKRKDMNRFRREIAQSLFPCLRGIERYYSYK
ncbi:MAG: mono/diheme cytochrome c family protein [Flavobacteriaceae bacterium]|jgi:mono/diheme cytochrome c family protein